MNSSNNLIIAITRMLPIAVLSISLSSCGSSGDSVKVPKTDGFQQSHGPFDEHGNYVEKWADSPPKRRYTSKKPGRSISTVKPKKTSYQAPKKTYTPPVTKKSMWLRKRHTHLRKSQLNRHRRKSHQKK